MWITSIIMMPKCLLSIGDIHLTLLFLLYLGKIWFLTLVLSCYLDRVPFPVKGSHCSVKESQRKKLRRRDTILPFPSLLERKKK